MLVIRVILRAGTSSVLLCIHNIAPTTMAPCKEERTNATSHHLTIVLNREWGQWCMGRMGWVTYVVFRICNFDNYHCWRRIPPPNWMNFWKSAKGGGGVIFNPKNYVADFGNLKQGFLSMKLIKRRVNSGFRVCFFNNCIDINWYLLILSGLCLPA